MEKLSPEELLYYHDGLTCIMVCVWFLISYYGFYSKKEKKIYISYGLIVFALSQEIVDYLNRFFFDTNYNLSWQSDLPLQFCHFGFYFSIYLIYIASTQKKINKKTENFIFDCAYVLGFAGAFQSLLNFDDTGVNNLIGAFTLNWQHSLIILNILWLIFAYNKKFTLRGVFNAFIFINIIIIPVGFINYLLDANYMFICDPPNVESMFFVEEWPVYLIRLELIYLIYVLILLLPFEINKRVKKLF